MGKSKAERTNPELQDILDNAGYSHIFVIDKDNVKCVVDDEWETFNRNDRYSGHPMSGYANFGSVGGDHRMIAAIAENIAKVFELLGKTITPKHSLHYKRMATKHNDGAKGFMYVHVWPTGYQELIFPSKEAAAKYLAAVNKIDIQPNSITNKSLQHGNESN